MIFTDSAHIVATFFELDSGLPKLKEIILTAAGRVYGLGYQKIDEKPTLSLPAPKSNHGTLIDEKSCIVTKYINPLSSFLPSK